MTKEKRQQQHILNLTFVIKIFENHTNKYQISTSTTTSKQQQHIYTAKISHTKYITQQLCFVCSAPNYLKFINLLASLLSFHIENIRYHLFIHNTIYFSLSCHLNSINNNSYYIENSRR